MILAIDVGNTNIVLGCIEDGDIRSIVRIQTNPGETAAEYAIKLKQILEIYNISPRAFEGAIISSVVPPLTNSLKEAVRKLTGIECLVVGPGMRTGMNVRIDDPGTLVLDMGTATTIVAIDRSRAYIGGAIIPGVNLSYGALAAGTSLLPSISITAPKKVIATNTVDSMRSGAVYGTAAMLDGMIERMEAELSEKCTVVATGGLASSIIPYCRREIICDDDLLLKGLWILYKKNK